MREMKKGSLGLLILHLLHERPSYGYELTERLRERSQGDLSFEDAAVYPLLHAFERDQLVEGVWEQEESGADGTETVGARKGARRRYYHLTPRGVEALRAALQDWTTFSRAVGRVLGAEQLSREGAR
jgi:DNA-binding PadR family transcriptional regulator